MFSPLCGSRAAAVSQNPVLRVSRPVSREIFGHIRKQLSGGDPLPHRRFSFFLCAALPQKLRFRVSSAACSLWRSFSAAAAFRLLLRLIFPRLRRFCIGAFLVEEDIRLRFPVQLLEGKRFRRFPARQAFPHQFVQGLSGLAFRLRNSYAPLRFRNAEYPVCPDRMLVADAILQLIQSGFFLSDRSSLLFAIVSDDPEWRRNCFALFRKDRVCGYSPPSLLFVSSKLYEC